MQRVLQVVQQAIAASKPKARYHVNIPFSAELIMRLGDPVWDLVLRSIFKIDPSNMN